MYCQMTWTAAQNVQKNEDNELPCGDKQRQCLCETNTEEGSKSDSRAKTSRLLVCKACQIGPMEQELFI